MKSEETVRIPEKCDLAGVDAGDVIFVAVMPVSHPLSFAPDPPPAFPRPSVVDITPSERAQDRILSLSWKGVFAWGTASLSTALELVLAAKVSPVSR